METNSKTILIIEDDASLIELFSDKIESCGYRTVRMKNAENALSWLNTHTPFLIILDFSLPDMNGKEFIAELKAKELPLPPFIVSTGHGDERLAVEIMKLGARDYVIKDNHLLDMIPLIINKVCKEIDNENKLRLAEAEIRLSNDKHGLMIANISDVIGIIGVDGFMKYKSPNITKWFGWQPQDLIGTDCFLTVHPDDTIRIQKEFFLLLEKDNSGTTVEYRYKCKDGNYKWIELTATNLTYDTIINGILLNYHDITKRKKEELEIIKLNDDLSKLMTQLDTIRDKECKRIALELHDELGQQLAAIKMNASWLMKRLVDDEKAKEALNDILYLCDNSIKVVRRISTDLRPEMLDQLGLYAAIEWQANEFSKRTGIRISMDMEEIDLDFCSSISLNIYRIFQETLNNILKHAAASAININLKYETGFWKMRIQDNGKGFNINSENSENLGILGMKERAKKIKGSFKIHSELKQGTFVEFSLPIAV